MSNKNLENISKYITQVRGVSYKPSECSDTSQEGYIPLLRAHNIQDEGLNNNKLVYVKASKVSEKQFINKDDILICASSGSKDLVGKAAQAVKNMNLSFGAFCKVIRPEKINPRYLGSYFRSMVYREKISNLSSGANIKNLKNEHFENLVIPIPTIEVQGKIADILDTTFELLQLRKDTLLELDNLIKSRFVEMFGDLKLNTMKWEIRGFGDFAVIDTKMVKDFEKYADYPHIGIDSIEKNTGKLKDYKTVHEDGVISGKYLFTSNHIIYSKIRPNLNKVALPDFEGVCSADAYPILPKERICNREFLGYAMRNDVFLSYILAFSSRTNLPKVNKKQVEGFSMPLPPLNRQNQFATFVQQVEKLKSETQKAIDNTQMLFDSLMQKYFE